MSAPLEDAARHLRDAAAAEKCWTCGCLHETLESVPAEAAASSPPLAEAVGAARERLREVSYDCLGCGVCFPALAANALAQAGHETVVGGCAAREAEQRPGWPPWPGSYQVLRYRAPVAVCTLTDEALAEEVAAAADPAVSVVGTLQTENLGIERLVANVVANPHVRFVVACGADSRQAVGHLPGQSLVCLARKGIDARRRIVGAEGRRPVLRNVEPVTVERFRDSVEVVDLVETRDVAAVLRAVRDCAERDPGPAAGREAEGAVAAIRPIHGAVPERMVPDPAGYFVVQVDRARRLLWLEHYRNDGLLDAVIEAPSAAAAWTPAAERGLVSRLDHAAYLGRELERAERALRSGEAYVQDAAPERGDGPATAQGMDSEQGTDVAAGPLSCCEEGSPCRP